MNAEFHNLPEGINAEDFKIAVSATLFADKFQALLDEMSELVENPAAIAAALAVTTVEKDVVGCGLALQGMKEWSHWFNEIVRYFDHYQGVFAELTDRDPDVRDEALRKHGEEPLVMEYIDKTVLRYDLLKQISREEIKRHGITEDAKAAIDARMFSHDVEKCKECGLPHKIAVVLSSAILEQGDRYNR